MNTPSLWAVLFVGSFTTTPYTCSRLRGDDPELTPKILTTSHCFASKVGISLGPGQYRER